MKKATRPRARILIVEDNTDFATLLGILLQSDGYDVFHAADGPQAYDTIKRIRPDLITLDIHMPRESGLLFYQRLRALNEFKATPVIVVTGLTRDDKDTEMTIKSFLQVKGMTPPAAYVEKQVVPRRLLDTVERVLSNYKPSADALTA